MAGVAAFTGAIFESPNPKRRASGRAATLSYSRTGVKSHKLDPMCYAHKKNENLFPLTPNP
jgi:hypothetical protein